MAIFEPLGSRMHDPSFWEQYTFETEGGPVPNTVVRLEVGDGCWIVIDMHGGHESYELGISTPDSSCLHNVGWDDLAHWHPYTFRWQELDDIDHAVETIEAAYASLRPTGWNGYWPTAARWLERNDFRGQDVTWHADSLGDHFATQPMEADRPFYSMRGEPTDEADGFPYGLWRALLAAATQTVAAGQRS